MMVTRTEVVIDARSYLGVRWRHQGRAKTGLDCVGLIVCVCKDLSISEYDSLVYGRAPDHAKFLSHFTAGGAIRINPIDAADADIIAFRQAGYPCHVGFRSTRYDRPHIIHAHMGHRAVVEEHLRPEAPIVAAYRLPKIED